MAEIIATGEIFGRETEITVNDNNGMEVMIDGGEWYNVEDGVEEGENLIIDAFVDELSQNHPTGGTFYPPTFSMINAYNVLKYHFFDDGATEIEVNGDIGEIPYEDGVIY